MQLFYAPDIAETNALPFEEAQHCFKVLRKKVGDEIQVINGKGGSFTCEITNDHPKKNEIKILNSSIDEQRASQYVHIAIAPTKNLDRIEWFVEKATEIGIDEISFLLCKHSERKVLKMERLLKKAVSAMKQSGKLFLPKLNELQSYASFVNECNNEDKLIAHLRDDTVSIEAFKEQQNICILIGPEGDFSVDEINLASQQKFQSVTLGSSRLRTETAGIVAAVHFSI